MLASRLLARPAIRVLQPKTSSLRRGCMQSTTSSLSSFSSQSASNTNNNTNLIINTVGLDRLGIVSDITGLVIEHGGNVGESQAARLGSHFSLMMIVSLPSDKLAELQMRLDSLDGMSHAAVFETQDSVENATTPAAGYSGRFRLEGADHPGIVHKITSALVQHGLSIERLGTDQEIAPHGGTTLFKMTGIASASAPLASGFNAEHIKDELEALGESLNCDVTMEDLQ